jgi:hypothetical protein
MRLESLYPEGDIYQIIDDSNTVLFQGTYVKCMAYLTLNTK